MTWQVFGEPRALSSATGYLKDDPSGVDALLQATDRLTENPRPSESSPWGIEHRRLRYGPWRMLYRIDEVARTLCIEQIGRIAV